MMLEARIREMKRELVQAKRTIANLSYAQRVTTAQLKRKDQEVRFLKRTLKNYEKENLISKRSDTTDSNSNATEEDSENPESVSDFQNEMVTLLGANQKYTSPMQIFRNLKAFINKETSPKAPEEGDVNSNWSKIRKRLSDRFGKKDSEPEVPLFEEETLNGLFEKSTHEVSKKQEDPVSFFEHEKPFNYNQTPEKLPVPRSPPSHSPDGIFYKAFMDACKTPPIVADSPTSLKSEEKFHSEIQELLEVMEKQEKPLPKNHPEIRDVEDVFPDTFDVEHEKADWEELRMQLIDQFVKNPGVHVALHKENEPDIEPKSLMDVSQNGFKGLFERLDEASKKPENRFSLFDHEKTPPTHVPVNSPVQRTSPSIDDYFFKVPRSPPSQSTTIDDVFHRAYMDACRARPTRLFESPTTLKSEERFHPALQDILESVQKLEKLPQTLATTILHGQSETLEKLLEHSKFCHEIMLDYMKTLEEGWMKRAEENHLILEKLEGLSRQQKKTTATENDIKKWTSAFDENMTDSFFNMEVHFTELEETWKKEHDEIRAALKNVEETLESTVLREQNEKLETLLENTASTKETVIDYMRTLEASWNMRAEENQAILEKLEGFSKPPTADETKEIKELFKPVVNVAVSEVESHFSEMQKVWEQKFDENRDALKNVQALLKTKVQISAACSEDDQEMPKIESLEEKKKDRNGGLDEILTGYLSSVEPRAAFVPTHVVIDHNRQMSIEEFKTTMSKGEWALFPHEYEIQCGNNECKLKMCVGRHMREDGCSVSCPKCQHETSPLMAELGFKRYMHRGCYHFAEYPSNECLPSSCETCGREGGGYWDDSGILGDYFRVATKRTTN